MVLSMCLHESAQRVFVCVDFPVMVSYVLEERPWLRRENGLLKKWVDGEWKGIPTDDMLRVCQSEVQCWLSLSSVIVGWCEC